MANSIWRARTRERLVVLTGEEVRYEGEGLAGHCAQGTCL